LELASYTLEKFELYKKYQIHIHHDPESKLSPKSFNRFLVDTPLTCAMTTPRDPDHPFDCTPENYQSLPLLGSYHLLYYVDGVLIAVSVLDFLPRCISSVYFYYDPDWNRFSLGKLSALFEIALTMQEKNRTKQLGTTPGERERCDDWMQYYYMGYYVPRCQKMEYKAQFQPSELLDPSLYSWIEIKQARLLMESSKNCASFQSRVEFDSDDPTLRMISDEELNRAEAFSNGDIKLLRVLYFVFVF
jgi:arginine-tRNA-protein transferase